MTSYLKQIVQKGIILCPNCRNDKNSSISLDSGMLYCVNCNRQWHIKNGVPDLFNKYEIEQGSINERKNDNLVAVAEKLVQVLSLRDEQLKIVEEILIRADNFSSGTLEMVSEINDVEGRFFPKNKIVFPPVDPEANKNPKFRIKAHYFPTQAAFGSSVTANIRITNTGEFPWSSRPDLPLLVSYCWIDQRGQQVSSTEFLRFPVDIAPGRSITLPLKTKMPHKRFESGILNLKVGLTMGNNEVQPDADSKIITVKTDGYNGIYRVIIERLFGQKKTISPTFNNNIESYADDHARGVDMIREELKKLGDDEKQILEIGSGTHPQAAWFENSKLLAVDISFPQMELGNLYFQERGMESKVAFLCADAINSPLQKESFDSIVIFSALHHFPDPILLLFKLRELLKPGGFLAVMCEPVNDTLEVDVIIQDLLKGINEQVFTLNEYVRIFNKAGMVTHRLEIDGQSLKAILRK